MEGCHKCQGPVRAGGHLFEEWHVSGESKVVRQPCLGSNRQRHCHPKLFQEIWYHRTIRHHGLEDRQECKKAEAPDVWQAAVE
eukprot:15365659-Ditylum_brightwellii.AAC.1